MQRVLHFSASLSLTSYDDIDFPASGNAIHDDKDAITVAESTDSDNHHVTKPVTVPEARIHKSLPRCCTTLLTLIAGLRYSVCVCVCVLPIY